MMPAFRADDIWTELEQSSGANQLRARRVPHETDRDIFLTFDSGNACSGFAVGVDEPPQLDDEALTAHIRVRTARESLPKRAHAVHVELIGEDFRDVFAAFVDDLVPRICSAGSDEDAIVSLLSRVDEWRRLLLAITPTGLGPERQIGLYAELHVLSTLVRDAVGMVDALAAWTGGSGTHHDFELATAAIEVKATRGKQHNHIRISSERQLEPGGSGRLFLAHHAFDVRRLQGDTLDAIAARLRELFRPVGLASAFDDKLREYGYEPAALPAYSTTGYTLRRRSIFEVKEKFPRLVEADLMQGVGDVAYSISMSACQQFEVDITTLEEALGAERS